MVYVMLFSMLIVLYFHICTSWSMCEKLNVAGFYCLCFPRMLLRYFLNDLEWFQLPLLLLVFTFHRHCISMVRPLIFRIFFGFFFKSYSCLLKLQHLLTYIPSSLSQIMMSSLLLPLICTCWFHDMVTLPSRFVSTNFGYIFITVFIA